MLFAPPVIPPFRAPRDKMPIPVVSKAIIANCPTRPPIGMSPDPHVETRHPGAVAYEPDIAGAQIIRHPTNVPAVSDPIDEHIGVRNFYCYHRRGRYYDWRRRNSHNWWSHVYSARLHNTTCH